MHCFSLLRLLLNESIEKPFPQYTLCKSNVGMYSTIGEGGGRGVLKGSNMLISPAHAFCLDYAQQAQVVDPSIGRTHPVWRRKWFQGPSSPLLLHKPNSHIFLRPPSPEYCVNFGPKNINFLLRKCRAQGRHYANGAHVMMSPDTKMSPRNTITAYFPSVSPPSQTT